MAKKTEDLQGRIFGYLTVKDYAGLKQCGKAKQSTWNCVCKCGNLCVVKHHNLMRGGTKSCGCLRREMASKDLSGKTFGCLTVIEKQGYEISTSKHGYKDRNVVWKCLCNCGKVHFAKTHLLSNGHVRSCGCLKGSSIEDLTGRTFGELTAIKFHSRINNRTFWLCKCSCGKEKPLDAHHLKSGNQKSCGCRSRGWKHGLTKDVKVYHKYLMSDPIRKLRHLTSKTVRKGIKSKNGIKNGSTWKHLSYTPQQLKEHLEKLWEPWMNWDNYGGRPNDKRKTWWVDHIKPQALFPYKSLDDPLFAECWNLNNLRPLEKIANISKGDRYVSGKQFD